MLAASQQEPLYMSEAEYFEFEQASDAKHEFVGGQVVAMAGASWKHNIIGSNTNTQLNQQLFNKTCTVVVTYA